MQKITNLNEKNRALDILESAFESSPGMNWMLKKRIAKKQLRNFLSFFFHEAAMNDGAYLTTDKNGVVFFYQLQHKKTSVLLFFRKLYLLLFVMGIKNGIKAIRYKHLIERIRPKTGWCGSLVATDSSAKTVRSAYEIRNALFKISDETNQPIYLETTTPRAHQLYKAFGYKQYATIKHPYENITIWFMRRDPKSINA